MAINKIEIQSANGDIYYPHTSADVVKYNNNTVSAFLKFLDDKFNNYLPLAGGTISGNILCKTNNSSKLGSSTARFHTIYTRFRKLDWSVFNRELYIGINVWQTTERRGRRNIL